MKYMGSKNRHAKEILPIILADRRNGQTFVEPFVGGANVIDKVTGPRVGADSHPHLMAMWKAVADGWKPPSLVTEDTYAAYMLERPVTAECGYIGFSMSFGGKFFGGYRRDVAGTKGCVENMATQSRRSFSAMEKQAAALQGVDFRHSSYRNLEMPPRSLVYCDPPYACTTKYTAGAFDHADFWQWCDELVEYGHTLFVSEYAAPDHWQCVWEKTVNNTLTKDTGSKQGVERLFTRSA